MNFKKWVKNIQTAGYNGARTVVRKGKMFQSHHSKMQKDGWAKYIPNFAFK